MRLNTSLPGRNRVSPRLEGLESRVALSATAQQLPGGVLLVTGDNQADNIKINDDGTRVHVYSNGASLGTFYNITNSVVINTNGGDDHVQYDIQGDVPTSGGIVSVPVFRNIYMDLGIGNDFAQVDVVRALTAPGAAISYSSLSNPSNIFVQVKGGDGNDTAIFHAQTIDINARLNFNFIGAAGDDSFVASYGVQGGLAQGVASTVRLSFDGGDGNDYGYAGIAGSLPNSAQTYVTLNGGAGADSLYTYYLSGSINGFVNLTVNGGIGNDRIYTDFEMQAGSNLGQINAYIYGGDGDDDITAIYHKLRSQDGAQISSFVYGGTGTDTAHVTAGQAVAQVEILIPVA
jgi:hypothetical protein